MLVALTQDADPKAVQQALTARGLWIAATLRDSDGQQVTYRIAPYSGQVDPQELRAIPGVASVLLAAPEHPRMDRQGPRVDVGGVAIGGDQPVFMCGPCSVESEAQIHAIAARVATQGAQFLRGGAYKPRSSPYSFQGHGECALTWLRRAADQNGLRVVTEVLSEQDVERVAEQTDLMQVGSRNMQNFALLKRVGQTGRPVLLKRSMSATVEEWLLAGEYLLLHGASGVVLCERGIRSFDEHTRNLLDLGAVALLSQVHHLPVIVDPSHGTGRRDLILPLGRAALAAGAAGVMIETHDDPGRALSDGPQALTGEELERVLSALQGRKAA